MYSNNLYLHFYSVGNSMHAINQAALVTIDFYWEKKHFSKYLFYVPQEMENHTGLEWHEGG